MRPNVRSVTLFSLVLLLFATAAFEASAQELERPYFGRLLILDSFHDEYSWTERMVNAAIDVLKSYDRVQIEYVVDHLDLRRYQDEEYHRQLEILLAHKYGQGEGFDLIITFETPAMDLLLSERAEWFPDTPCVVAGTAAVTRAALHGHREWVTGVHAGLNYRGTIDLALSLHPGTKTVYVLAEDSRSGQQDITNMRQLEPLYDDKVSFRYLIEIPLDELPDVLGKLPQDSVLFTNGYSSGPEGKAIGYAGGWRIIGANAPVPIYSVYDQNVSQYAAAGGRVTTGELQGEYAANMALRILEGTPPAEIPVQRQAFTNYLDFAQLSRFGVRRSQFPEDAVVFNLPERSPTLYESYTGEVWAAISVFALLGVLVFVLSRALRQKTQAQNRLAESNRAFHILSECNQALIRATSEEEVSQSVCNILVDLGGYAHACIACDGGTSGTGLRQLACAGSPGDSSGDLSAPCAEDRRFRDGPVATAVAMGTRQVLNDLHTDQVFPAWSRRARQLSVRSTAAVPLSEDGTARGALCVCSSVPARIDEAELSLLGELAGDLNYGIASLRAAEARRAAEAALSESRQFLQGILETSPLAVILVDAQGVIIYANAQANALLAPGDSALEKRRYHDLNWRSPEIDAGPVEDSTSPVEKVLRTRKPVLGMDQRLEGADGRILYLSVSAAPLLEADGSLRGVVTLLEDVGDRVQAQRELAEARDAAQESSRTKTMFMANMSHEFRTPLNGIIGMAELLDASELTPSQKRHLAMLRQSATMLSRMIQDVLDFSQIDAGTLTLDEEEFDLHELVQELVHYAMVQIDTESVHVSWRVADNCRHCRGDRTRIAQIIYNLLSNATKYTQMGTISLSVTADEQLTILVEDHGAGMQAEHIPRAFETFRQLENPYTKSHRGLGIGLSIVRGLVDLMGGRLSLQSAPGQGTTARADLPLDHAQEPLGGEEDLPDLSPDGPSASPLAVLLVEDEAINRMYLESLLRSHGCNVVGAPTGKDALRHAAEDAYDLILMDIGLPDIDGVEVTRRLKTGGRDIRSSQSPVVAVTAHTGEEDQRRYREAGMVGLVSKPFSAADIASLLAQHAPQGRSGHG